ncbi:MAG: RimK family alpha-L-glutamate ligase [Gammaproteobacteria bacterium]|nr:RimK family alpha-L-glutamate ligase [Gammaproteobacteria bacterium]
MSDPVQSKPGSRSVTDDPGWHGRELRQALAARGFGSGFVSLTDCRLEPGREPVDTVLPGFGRELPAGVFVRGVPGGSLERVILRLDILHALEMLGVPLMNTPRVIERTVDKGLSSLLLARAGLPTPPTWVCESDAQARAIVRRELAAGHRLVGKPLFGSQGEGLQLFDDTSSIIAHAELSGGAYYLQRFIERAPGDWSDIRVFVIGGRAVAAMTRRGEHWITNRAQGARCEALPVDAQLAQLAQDAAAVLGADYAGVDLMLDINNKLQLIEVNGIPAWWGLERATGVSIAPLLINALLARLPRPDLTVISS